jgi:hypothetical protein
MSIALIEAISAGLFPVVSKIAGSNDFVENLNLGARCSANDYSGFAEAIEVGLSEFNKNINMRLDYARGNFDILISAKKYLHLCQLEKSTLKKHSYTFFKIPINYHDRLIYYVFSLLKSKIKALLMNIK